MNCNQSRPGFELVSSCPIPTTITITPPVAIYLSFRFHILSHCGLPGRQSPPFDRFSFFFVTIAWSGRLAEIMWSFYISLTTYMIEFNFFDTTLSGLPFTHSHVLYYTLFCEIFCIRLIYGWSFRLYLHIAYTCYFDSSYLHWLQCNLSL